MTLICVETPRVYAPTAFGPRLTDVHGSGAWHARRGSRLHMGLDWETQPWGPVMAPIGGVVVRVARPYRNPKGDINTGLLIEGTGLYRGWKVKLFYCSPLVDVMGYEVDPREVIAMARPMREEYAGITPHAHIALKLRGVAVDPTPYLEAA